jgi:hypothetical protein
LTFKAVTSAGLRLASMASATNAGRSPASFPNAMVKTTIVSSGRTVAQAMPISVCF